MPLAQRFLPLAVVTGLLVGDVRRADAQTVQQPVVSTFGVTTTVSVPDRGSILLGGVSRAADSRTTAGFGPWRSRSGIGLERGHSSLIAHVTIVDLREMDEQALSQAAATTPDDVRLTGHAAHAFEQLTGVREQPLPVSTSTSPATRRGTDRGDRAAFHVASPSPTVDVVPSESKAEKFLRLGRAAEAEGKLGLAKLHYRAAERAGSPAATERLATIAGR